MPQLTYRLILVGIILASAQGGSVLASDKPAVFAEEGKIDFSAPGVIVREGDVLTGPKMMQRGFGVSKNTAIWEDGIVPYYIDHELQSYLEVIVQSAVDTWNAVGGITLVKIDPRAWDAPEDYLHFVPAQGCASWVGRQGGPQQVWTGAGCSRGSMMHEIGHALGLEHEHTRPDRDQHIAINWENIDSDKVDNFAISDHSRRTYGPYDYGSIMHYGEYFFSANDNPTIKPLQGDGVSIGQRLAPSAGDIRAIAMLYSSDISLVSHVVTENGQSEVSLLISNEHLQGANMLELSMFIGDAQLVSNNNIDWDCFTYDSILSCNRDRLAGSEQSSIILSFDKPLSEAELNPTLNSKTPDDNLANNGGLFSPAAAQGVNPQGQVMPLSDQQVQANLGATSYSIGGLGFLLALRLMRRQKHGKMDYSKLKTTQV